MKVILDYDDFSPKNTNFGLLEKMKEHFPDFKVTLFTVPWEVRWAEQTPLTLEKFEPFCRAVAETDWIEIALHGLTHEPAEFLKLSYEDAKKRLLVGEKMFINKKIPYVKLFKAPFWQLSEAAKRAAQDLGWVVCEDHYYNWNLKDDRPNEELLIAHGHVQETTGNGMEETFMKIMSLPPGTQFSFLSEHFKAPKIDPSQLDFRDPLNQVELRDKSSGKELK